MSSQLAIASTSHCLATDPSSVLCFCAYIIASWLQSSCPCSLRTALINCQLKTLCLKTHSQSPNSLTAWLDFTVFTSVAWQQLPMVDIPLLPGSRPHRLTTIWHHPLTAGFSWYFPLVISSPAELTNCRLSTNSLQLNSSSQWRLDSTTRFVPLVLVIESQNGPHRKWRGPHRKHCLQ
jgi:hypothetical protein